MPSCLSSETRSHQGELPTNCDSLWVMVFFLLSFISQAAKRSFVEVSLRVIHLKYTELVENHTLPFEHLLTKYITPITLSSKVTIVASTELQIYLHSKRNIRNQIIHIDRPAKLPDLNPMRNLWDHLMQFLRPLN